MATAMDEQEFNLWKKVDVRVGNRLQRLVNAVYLEDMDLAKAHYTDFMNRYFQIDTEELDDRFPVSAIKQARDELVRMGCTLSDYKKLGEHAENLKRIALGFGTERYMLYRSMIAEPDRESVPDYETDGVEFICALPDAQIIEVVQ